MKYVIRKKGTVDQFLLHGPKDWGVLGSHTCRYESRWQVEEVIAAARSGQIEDWVKWGREAEDCALTFEEAQALASPTNQTFPRITVTHLVRKGTHVTVTLENASDTDIQDAIRRLEGLS